MAQQCTKCGQPTEATIKPTDLCEDCFVEILEEVKQINGRDDRTLYQNKIERMVFEEILGNCMSDEAASDAAKKVCNILIKEGIV